MLSLQCEFFCRARCFSDHTANQSIPGEKYHLGAGAMGNVCALKGRNSRLEMAAHVRCSAP